MPESWQKREGDFLAKVAVRVQPNARKDEVMSYTDGLLHLKIAAPPVKGKANQEVVEFLSEILEVRKSSLNVDRGLKDRRKIVSVEGLTQEQVERKLARWK